MNGFFVLCLVAAAFCHLISAFGAATNLLKKNQRMPFFGKRLSIGLALAGFALHSLALLLVMLALVPWDNSCFLYLTAWVFMLVYLTMRGRAQADFLNLVCAAPAGLLLPIGLAMREEGFTRLAGDAWFSGPLFTIHVAAMFAGLACMVVGCGAGLAFLYLERVIKQKTPLAEMNDDFPSLTRLDRLGRLTVLWGFPLFSLGLIAGFAWANKAWGGFLSWDIKEIFSVLVWFLYATLFYIRLRGIKGRRPARLAIWIFGLSMFSLLVVNLALPSHHSFMPWGK